MTFRLSTILLVLVLSGCGFVSYEDVSTEAAYSSYVGAWYQTNSDMHLYRVSMDKNYGPTPSIYEIVPPPGFSGPEVLSKTPLPEGSLLRIVAVERCTNCYLDAEPRVHMVARLAPANLADSFEVQVADEVLSEHMDQAPANASGS